MKKRFGQHFLTDRSILRRIVEFAHIDPQESVLEIGPGAGSLTAALAGAAHRVVTIEIDRDLIPSLRASVPANVDVLEGDALEIEWPSGVFHVVGNLPYNIATAILQRLIEQRRCITDMTLMLQREVVDRGAQTFFQCDARTPAQ